MTWTGSGLYFLLGAAYLLLDNQVERRWILPRAPEFQEYCLCSMGPVMLLVVWIFWPLRLLFKAVTFVQGLARGLRR